VSDPGLVRVCRVDQLVEGRGRPVRIDGRYLAVFLVEGRVHVVDNQCLHVGSPIDGGPVRDGVVHCPWHGWAYRLEDGAHLTAFGDRPGLRTYPCVVTANGEVQVQLDHTVGD
jgi:3-phenylpropionate/trans-cinnamate dioxygenase ferredoxin subunit